MTPAVEQKIPGALNAVIVGVQVAAVAACLVALPRCSSWLALGTLALVFGMIMNSVYSTIHEAEHGILLGNRRANETAGVLLALLFPAPFHLLRQGHLGHHLRNRSDDEAFDLIIEGENAVWKRFQLLGILTGFYWVVVAVGNVVVLAAPGLLARRFFDFDRASAALMDSLNPRYWRWIRLEALAAVLLHAGLLVLLGVPFLHYAVFYFGFGWMWSALQYVHHFGTERHPTRGARNLWICGPLDLLWLHHNWHRAHHEHPTVPWIHLPRLGRSDPQPRGFLPLAYLAMWRGPQHTNEHVENRHAGRIIR